MDTPGSAPGGVSGVQAAGRSLCTGRAREAWGTRVGDRIVVRHARSIVAGIRDRAGTRPSGPGGRLWASSQENHPGQAGSGQDHVDDTMRKQSAFFGNTCLARYALLTQPGPSSGRAVKDHEDRVALGGMRRPDLSVQSHSRYSLVGAQLWDMLSGYVDEHQDLLQVVDTLRQGLPVEGIPQQHLQAVRQRWLEVMRAPLVPRGQGPDADTLQAWGRATHDPDAARVLPGWLRMGAPLGILQNIETTGVFPATVPTEVTKDPLMLISQLTGWTNYSSAEDQLDVVQGILEQQEQRDHCQSFTSYEQLCSHLGVDKVVLTKVGLISKEKSDGSFKHRLIWDLLRSEVNDTVHLDERIVLPRLQDAVDDARELLRQGAGEVEWLVLDVADAFHNVPVMECERRFACGKVGDRYICFKSLCMGGKSAPNIWGRFAAAIGRVVASIMPSAEQRTEIYVDDPLLCARGSRARRTHLFTVALLAITVLGFPMSWGKGVLGTDVVWIGARLAVVPAGIQVAIPEDKLRDLQRLTAEFLGKSVVSRRAVKAFCGKLSFVAGMVPTLRPFVRMVWAALLSPSRLPQSIVHVRRFNVALDWLKALFDGIYGPLIRIFTLQEVWADVGDYIATDASPWGFAGVLFKNFVPVAWYATPLPESLLRHFQAKSGDSSFNTLWEALAILVAIRLWLPGTRVLARVRSDSLAALRSIVKMQSPSPSLNLIAREIALDATLGLYHLGVAVHIPGIANRLPDDLSRLWAPEPHQIPPELVDVPQHQVPVLGGTFWRTSAPAHRGGLQARQRHR